MLPYTYELFTANKVDYLKLKINLQPTSFMVDLIVKTIEAKERLSLAQHVIIFTIPQGNWYGWAYHAQQVLPQRFCSWLDAARGVRENNQDMPLSDCFISATGELILSPAESAKTA